MTNERSGDWTCSCGQLYRVLIANGEVQMWPKNSAYGFRADPIGDVCLCGEPLGRGTVVSALYGAVAACRDRLEPLDGTAALAGGRVVGAEELQVQGEARP